MIYTIKLSKFENSITENKVFASYDDALAYLRQIMSGGSAFNRAEITQIYDPDTDKLYVIK